MVSSGADDREQDPGRRRRRRGRLDRPAHAGAGKYLVAEQIGEDAGTRRWPGAGGRQKHDDDCGRQIEHFDGGDLTVTGKPPVSSVSTPELQSGRCPPPVCVWPLAGLAGGRQRVDVFV